MFGSNKDREQEVFYSFSPGDDITAKELAQIIMLLSSPRNMRESKFDLLPKDLKRHFICPTCCRRQIV